MPSYPELLSDAIDAAKTSNRALSFQLAEATGNQPESERRSLRRYLAGETPSRERAAILAVLLREPALALVSDAQSRRQDRLEEVAAGLDQLRREFELFVEGVTGRRVDYEEDQEPTTPQSSPASKERPAE